VNSRIQLNRSLKRVAIIEKEYTLDYEEYLERVHKFESNV